MSDVVPHSAARAVGNRFEGSGIAGRQLSDSTWSGTVVEFGSLGIAVPESFGQPVSSGVIDDPRVHRKPSHHRKRTAWHAARAGIVVAEYRQAVVPRPDGRFGTRGGYEIAASQQYPVTGPPRRRVGDVPDDRGSGQAPAQGGGSAVRRPHPAEAELAFLPEAVRASFMSRVGEPTYFCAEAIRWDHGARHTVAALRMDATSAVVVQAARQRGAAEWQVEQVEYSLRPALSALDGRW